MSGDSQLFAVSCIEVESLSTGTCPLETSWSMWMEGAGNTADCIVSMEDRIGERDGF